MTIIANVTQSGVTEILWNAWLLRGGGTTTNHYNRLMSEKKPSLFFPSGTFNPNTAIKSPAASAGMSMQHALQTTDFSIKQTINPEQKSREGLTAGPSTCGADF